MARIEKTVFISYRRKDISWALAVYQYLTSQKYDVFFDYTHIPSGDFEQIIVSNIKARAHFVLILTPTALDRTSNEGDWLRREIETAIDEKRNIIPLFFDGFSFGSPSVAEKLTGKLSTISRYNGLDIPSGYFPEAMERLSTRYLNVPLEAVLLPVPKEVQYIVDQEKLAVDKIIKYKQLRPFAAGLILLLLIVFSVFMGKSMLQNRPVDITPLPSETNTLAIVTTSSSTEVTPISTSTVPPTSTPTLGIGSTKISPQDSMNMVFVPEGEFPMGSDIGDPNEKPVHSVFLSSFLIDQTSITNAMFAEFVEKTEYETDAEKAGNSYMYQFGSFRKIDGANWLHPSGPENGISAIMDHPVVHMSWNDAKAYCKWADRRLPTEAEWEKAASWDDKSQLKLVYPWGDEFVGSLLNFCDQNCSFNWADGKWNDGFEFTSPVGTYLNGASPYGALDMAGNVWDWVDDWYDAYPGNTSNDSEYGTTLRVLRGGSWSFNPYDNRPAFRNRFDPSGSTSWFGFRCAMDSE